MKSLQPVSAARGVVYNVLLAGLEGGVSLAWANSVSHIVLPLYAALDWVIFSDHSALPLNTIGSRLSTQSCGSSSSLSVGRPTDGYPTHS